MSRPSLPEIAAHAERITRFPLAWLVLTVGPMFVTAAALLPQALR